MIELVKFLQLLGINVITILLCWLYYYFTRDKWDDRYVKKDEVPKEKCYQSFLTIQSHEDKEATENLRACRIEESLKELKDMVYQIFYKIFGETMRK